MNNFRKTLKAFSLVELILAIGIFATISSMLIFLVVDARSTLSNTQTRAKATDLIQDINNSIFLIKEQGWGEIVGHTNDGQKHIERVDNTYEIADGVGIFNDFLYYFTITHAQRDIDGFLTESGGQTDLHTRLIEITIEWQDSLGRDQSIISNLYLNDWHTYTIIATTEDDFNTGIHDQTAVVADVDGEIILQSRFYSDWCEPENTMTGYDMPEEVIPRSVFSLLGYSYLGTRGSSSGYPFTKVRISGVNPPELEVEGHFLGYNVNDIFVQDEYAFLATTDDSKEVVILDVSSLPYQEIGYYNAPDTYDGYSVYVDGDVGYLGQGRFVRTFDLSGFTGSRNSLGSKDLGSWLFKWVATVSQLYVKDNYVYAVLNWDWYELVILNASNPSNMVITSQTSVNNQQVYDMQISEDGNRTYFGTTASSSENELFIIDTTQKNGSRPIISSIDSNGTTIRGIAVIEDDNIMIAVGTGGEEYQVYNISEESSPSQCGGMDVNNGIYDIDSIRDLETNAFSYIITGDTDSEFKIIRGGPGGGGTNGYGYFSDGVYTSPIYDTGSDISRYHTLSTTTTVPLNSSLKIQIRTSNSPDMGGSEWIGPDGSTLDYFENSEMYHFPANLEGRFFQYKLYLTSDTVNTPLLEEIIINYEK